jgi:hypothetical protein
MIRLSLLDAMSQLLTMGNLEEIQSKIGGSVPFVLIAMLDQTKLKD